MPSKKVWTYTPRVYALYCHCTFLLYPEKKILCISVNKKLFSSPSPIPFNFSPINMYGTFIPRVRFSFSLHMIPSPWRSSVSPSPQITRALCPSQTDSSARALLPADDKWVVCFFMENSSKRCRGGDLLSIFGRFRDGFSIVK